MVTARTLRFYLTLQTCNVYLVSCEPSDLLYEFCSVQSGSKTCIDDVLSWINSDKLILNKDKTEVLAFGT